MSFMSEIDIAINTEERIQKAIIYENAIKTALMLAMKNATLALSNADYLANFEGVQAYDNIQQHIQNALDEIDLDKPF